MSVALQNLRSAIATNTLTSLQQGALTQALDAIIPSFPTVDPSGVAQPPRDGLDAREWIAVLYTIQSTSGGTPLTVVNEILPAALPSPVTVTPNPGVGNVTLGFTSPSRSASSNAGVPIALSATPTNGVTAALTPSLTGRLRAMITGRVTNTDASPHAFILNVNANTGIGPDFTIQTMGSVTIPAGGVAAFAITVDLDQGSQVAAPHTFAVGTTATIIAQVTGVAGGFLSIPANGLFLSVQELLG
jgi:hypothetical protein